MTSALEGVVEKQTKVLISCVSGTVTRGEGIEKSEHFADVINGSSLFTHPFLDL